MQPSLAQQLDLVNGKSTPTLRLPIRSKLLAISPVARIAVVASDFGDRAFRKAMARIDVISSVNSGDGGPSAPRENVSTQTVVWATMPDDESVISPAVVRPGGKQIAARQGDALLLIDIKTGDSLGTLAPEALAGAEMKSAAFSDDGAYFFAATSHGLFRWDITTGQSGNPITTESFNTLAELSGQLLLLDDRLFDPKQQAVLYRYPVFGGCHVTGGSGGRHWYIACGPLDGTPYLCSVLLATPEQLAAAAKVNANPPLIRPGKQVALQVNAGTATERVTGMLAAKLKSRGLDKGDVVATLRVTATESPTGEEKSILVGPNSEKTCCKNTNAITIY